MLAEYDSMIDTHVHLASDDLEMYPHAEHPPFETKSYVHTASDLRRDMAEAGVVQATVVQPFGIYGMDNSYQADSAQHHPDQFAAVCGIPATGEGVEALRYWVAERGMVGARVMTLGQGTGLTDDGYLAVCQAAVELDVPVCLLTSRKYLPDLADLANRVSDVRIVLDHLGWSGAVEDPERVVGNLMPLAGSSNVFLKISTPLLASGEAGRKVVEVILERFGAERIVWGTNYPVTDFGGYAATVAVSRAALAFLSPSDRAWILAKTARKLWPALARSGPPGRA